MSVPGRLVVILGPTASGKSALGIRLAQKLGGEIVVCDSTQVYRRFDIGTAKVSAADRQGVPHWMMDIVEPSDVFTAGDYRRRAEKILRDIHARGRVPIVTAGTGLYLRALLEGLADAPARSEELRARLRHSAKRSGAGHLHRMLHRLDPDAAARIAGPDTQKIIRALEIRFLAKKPLGEIHAQGRAPLEGFAVVKIGLRPPRAALYARIERRVHEMFDAGWLAEVRELLRSGVPPGAKPFTFIGYREILARDSSEFKLEETILDIQKATRQFAKRQLTWFRKEPNVHWLESFGDDPTAETQALAHL